MIETTATKNECRCEATDCGCAGTAERCPCDEPCTCKEACECGPGCGCA